MMCGMNKRILVIAVAAALAALSLASSAVAAVPGNLFGGGLVRAEVLIQAGGQHDYRVDRGRVTAFTPGSLTLLERDGTVVTVPVAPGAQPTLQRGVFVQTLRDGNAPASRVDVGAGARIAPFEITGPGLIRAELLLIVNGVSHDYRVDRGTVSSVANRTLTLAEADGTTVSIPIAAGARIRLNGVRVPLRMLKRGYAAETIRDGGGPAQIVDASRR
jgi:hypothetical protein